MEPLLVAERHERRREVPLRGAPRRRVDVEVVRGRQAAGAEPEPVREPGARPEPREVPRWRVAGTGRGYVRPVRAGTLAFPPRLAAS